MERTAMSLDGEKIVWRVWNDWCTSLPESEPEPEPEPEFEPEQYEMIY